RRRPSAVRVASVPRMPIGPGGRHGGPNRQGGFTMRRFHASLGRPGAATFLALGLAGLTGPPPQMALAATNTAVGNIAGVDADLNDSNTITLTTTTLSLVKAAFLSDGTPISSGATLAKGTVVKFLIYMDNTTPTPVDSVNVSDALAATFAYQAGTL